MNNRIDARLAALVAEVERRRLIQEEPDDDLSRSLFNLRQELVAGLDTLGKSALLHELNNGDPLEGTMGLSLSMENLKKMISNFAE